jgi:hypothetical protein
MKLILGFMLLLFLGFGAAVEIDDACSSRGFEYTLSSWVWDEKYTLVDGYEGVSVVGSARKFNWTSDIYIDGVVYKSGSRTYLSDGGFNGSVPKTSLSNDVSFVVFCSHENFTVPEFGIVGAGLCIAIGCMVLFRKR